MIRPLSYVRHEWQETFARAPGADSSWPLGSKWNIIIEDVIGGGRSGRWSPSRTRRRRWWDYDYVFGPIIGDVLACFQELIAHLTKAHLRLVVPITVRMMMLTGLLESFSHEDLSKRATGGSVMCLLSPRLPTVDLGMQCDCDCKVVILWGILYRER